MKKEYLILLCFILISIFGKGQNNSRIEQFYSADSIVVISHKTINGSTTILLDSIGNQITSPLFYIDGDVNQEIINKRILLDENQINSFVEIIKDLPHSKVSGSCNDPHHAILIYKGAKMSYIDYCFTCKHYSTGPSEITGMSLSENQWKELRLFFKKLELID